ncbi:hypothetical protein U1Q18_013127 [Sarracenia purpurea var. burkii]
MAHAALSHQLHIFFIPFMAPGHQVPMLDMARLVASRGVKVSMVTTAGNLSRFQSVIDNDRVSGGLDINLHALNLPYEAAGLPPNCENFDSLPTRFMSGNFCKAILLLQPQADDLVGRHRPDAIISDLNLIWPAEIARKYRIPQIGFHVTSCFSLSVTVNVMKLLMQEGSNSKLEDSEPFLVPDMPKEVYVKKSQTPMRSFSNLGMDEFFMEVGEAEQNTRGVVINTFYEMEGEFIENYKRSSGKQVWAVGPYMLYDNKALSMAARGKKASIDTDNCLAWLDSKQPNSVIYVCFGSVSAFAESQLVEIGLGLEASNCNFIWVIKDHLDARPWLEGLEERVKGRGLIIKGWAPQLQILNHAAVGGFMTHCGWNSVLEALSFGQPMITWPLFGEQCYTEIFVLTQLKIGFEIGVDTSMAWGEEEEVGALVKRDLVKAAVTRMIGGGESVEEMRRRARELSKLARSAVKEGGSSSTNLDHLIEDLLSQKAERFAKGESIN